MIEAKQSRKRKGKDGNNTQDPEAAYNVEVAADGKRKTTYGVKMHANTDEDSFVKKMTYTPGNVHDSKEFDRLLDINTYKDKIKTYGEVYADSAYANKQNDKKIGKQNNKILHRAYRNKARAQLIAISHNLKTGMNIFKEMQQLKKPKGLLRPMSGKELKIEK